MLEPLYQTKLGALLLFFVLGLSWVLGGFMVLLSCVGCGAYSYGLSFAIFVVVAIESMNVRRAWSTVVLLGVAVLGPRHFSDPGFLRHWFSLAILVIMSFVMWWYRKFPASPWFMKGVQDLGFAAYYKRLELSGALEDIEKEGCMFGFHPHGILSVGFSCNGVWSKKFHDASGNNTQWLVDKVLREDNPFFKVICDLHGCVETLSKTSIQHFMGSRTNVAIVPGGFEDATTMVFGKDSTCILKRKGFIKYALQYGYKVYPVYTFGESSTYHTFTGCLKFRLWLCQFGVPTALGVGCPWLPPMPLKGASLLTCVGKPLDFPKLPNPSKDDVDKWHAAYIEALLKLFEEHKKEAGLPDSAKLNIL